MITAPAGTAIELLHVQPETFRASAALMALQDAAVRARMHIVPSSAYQGFAPWLLLWGPGEPSRAATMRRHVKAGGHVIALDLAYWSRETKARISIDAAHPQAWVMRRPLPPSRFESDLPTVGDVWDPDGPVIIAGIGQKATVQYGAAVVATWEAEMAAECRRRWPDRPVLTRPKQPGQAPIESALAGVSLVITWHSNVAVDAIRMGIPAVCRDGAAAAVCPSELPAAPQPLPLAVRDDFLGNLAYFQWAPNESAHCWKFLRELLS